MRLALTLAAVMAFAISLPAPAAGFVTIGGAGGSDGVVASPNPTPTGGTKNPRPAGKPTGTVAASNWSGQYSMYRARTFSQQRTNWYCVPASIQMMLNLINDGSDRSKANQAKYWQYAQVHSTYPVTDNGADAGGWAAAMRRWGAGNYTVGIHDSMQAALRAAAKRMRLTGKPVGLIAWGRNGGHGWVMTGFRSTGDPKWTDTYKVTSVQAMGALWPNGTINGRSYDPGPREWVGYSELQRKFTRFSGRRERAWTGHWLTVLP
ncbi:MAG: C39 family peptidase [Chloroflexota bacterium]